MQTQIIFNAGNSFVVAIPKHIAHEMNLKVGQKVTVDKKSDDTLVVKKVTRSMPKKSKSAAKAGFEAWRKIFMEENGEILDELAVR